ARSDRVGDADLAARRVRAGEGGEIRPGRDWGRDRRRRDAGAGGVDVARGGGADRRAGGELRPAGRQNQDQNGEQAPSHGPIVWSSPRWAAPRWRNRQTRRSPKPMSARTCGFDSRSRHHVGIKRSSVSGGFDRVETVERWLDQRMVRTNRAEVPSKRW